MNFAKSSRFNLFVFINDRPLCREYILLGLCRQPSPENARSVYYVHGYAERRGSGLRTIVWFRGKDLRVGDHEPLARAAAEGEVIPLFVLEPRFFGPGRAGRAPHRMQFLLESLADLQEGLSQRGSGLVLLEGPGTLALPRVAAQWKVDRVWAHRGSEPGGRTRDDQVGRALQVPLRLFEGETLTPPGSIRTRTGRPYSVFTAFKRAFLGGVSFVQARPAPESLPPLPSGIGLKASEVPDCADVGLEPSTLLLPGGEQAGRSRLGKFLTAPGDLYEGLRHRLDREATSRLSVDLKFGTLSVREVWQRSWEILMKYLADGDPPQNNLGWQWSAGCGCGAQPYFRVFNPVRQGKRFDPSGGYVRRWLPRLERLPNRYLHCPWEAPDKVLREAGVRLGQDYPHPVVDHSRARGRFLKVARNYLRGRGGNAEG